MLGAGYVSVTLFLAVYQARQRSRFRLYYELAALILGFIGLLGLYGLSFGIYADLVYTAIFFFPILYWLMIWYRLNINNTNISMVMVFVIGLMMLTVFVGLGEGLYSINGTKEFIYRSVMYYVILNMPIYVSIMTRGVRMYTRLKYVNDGYTKCN